jgi:CubicO group peptidase (beta-lactamase class C family)
MAMLRARRAFVLASVLVVTAAVTAIGQQQPPADFADSTSLPSGRRGERIRQTIDAINSGDDRRIEALVTDDAFGGRFRELPVAEHQAELLGLYERSQGVDFHSVRTYVPPRPAEQVVVIVRNRLTGGWHGLTFAFDGTPEERIVGLELSGARPPKDVPPAPPLTAAAAVEELRSFVDRLAAREAFSGTVVLARAGKPVFTAAHGLADRNHAVPMRLDTKLNLGSMNKMFTAVVIGQLVDEGRLSFEDPVSKHVSGWTKADLSKVKVKHLLSHTSGLGSYFNDTYDRTARHLLRRVSDYKPLVAEETLAFEPGTRGRYSNTGFLLAGAVVEAATGRDYFDVVRERVYAKAGMKNSDSYDIDLVVPGLGIGYSRERTAGGRTWRANTFAHVIRGGPAGGGYSTAEDLLAFAEALRSDRLVSAGTREALWSAKPDLGSPTYGYGFGVSRHPLGRVVGHGGGFNGISSFLDIYTESDWTAVALANVDWGADAVQQKIAELLGRVR